MKQNLIKELLDLPVDVVNLDDELMGITIKYYPSQLGGQDGSWEIYYADAGSSISAEGEDLHKVIEDMKKKIKKLDETPLRV